MSTQNAIETEVKIPVAAWTSETAHERLATAGFSQSAERSFEVNAVYDTPQQSIRGARMLLRLRRVRDRNVLTWKGPPETGPHKSRPELETKFDSFDAMHQILGHLGYSPLFRYEKYRTEFKGDGEGSITFDETPIGNFLELEGPGPWIDGIAGRLGFSSKDYLLESYGQLYLAHCEKMGVQPLNMVFSSSSKDVEATLE